MNDIIKLGNFQAHSGFPDNFYEGRYEHCRVRLEERFNSTLSRDEWQELNLAIFRDDPGTQYVDMGQDSESSLYLVSFRGEDMLVAFAENAYTIMTILPRNDIRLFHYKRGSLVSKAMCAADVVPRDNRRVLAGQLAAMKETDEGNWIKASADTTSQNEPIPSSAMAEKLAALRPNEQRNTLTVVPTKPINAEVAAVFAALSKRFTEQRQQLETEAEDGAARIASLEAEIASIRGQDAVVVMKRQFIDNAEGLANDAFAKHRDGLFDDAATLSVGRLILAQQPEPAVAVKPGITKGPRGSFTYTHGGKTRTLEEWAVSAGMKPQTLSYRIRNGMSFVDALTKPVLSRGNGKRSAAR